MSLEFEDVEAAMQMREIIIEAAQKEIQLQRPKYKYAEVESINRVTRKCMVHYLADPADVFVQVDMGSIQPVRQGQVVRIDGVAGDRYIQDVLGESYQYSPARVVASPEPDDATIGMGELTIRFDATPGAAKVYFKAKDANGSVVRGTINLT